MAELDLERVRNPVATVRCPECGSPATRERRASVVGSERLMVTCTACDWEEIVEFGPDGAGRRVKPEVWKASGGSLETAAMYRGHRPVCGVGGCRRISQEGGLCEGHYAEWVGAGRPEDREAWVESVGRRAKGRRTQERVTVSESKVNGSCQCEGCGKPVLRGDLCRGHYTRWLEAGRPELAAFLADKELTRPVRKYGGEKAKVEKPAAAAPVKKRVRERAAVDVPPAARASVVSIEAGSIQRLAFAEPLSAVLIMTLSEFILITDESGHLLHTVAKA